MKYLCYFSIDFIRNNLCWIFTLVKEYQTVLYQLSYIEPFAACHVGWKLVEVMYSNDEIVNGEFSSFSYQLW